MLEGRRADPTRVGEATASFELADRLHLQVGDRVRLHFVKAESFIPVAAKLLSEFGPRLEGGRGAQASTLEQLADGPDITFHVVGIEASPAEFPPLSADLSPVLHLTPAFENAYAAGVVGSPVMYTVFHERDQLDTFASGVERLAPGKPVGFVASRPGADREGPAVDRGAGRRAPHPGRADLRGAARDRCAGTRAPGVPRVERRTTCTEPSA